MNRDKVSVIYHKREGYAHSGVSVIPPTKCSVHSGLQPSVQKPMRVAAYCRVSTGDESQQTSYTNQKAFYTELIQSKKGWYFAGVYADEAISGTSRAHRVEFNRMIEDAKAGKLDYIVTKSISRFARNTVDTLNCVRELRQQDPPVGIYFEKENIDTLDATGELILTILSALAQDESRSISDNIRWTFQKKFQAGIPQINLNRMLGYDQGENGQWVVNPVQARTVRCIFEKYVSGKSANRIAQELNAMGYATVNGKQWRADTVLNVLRNEKYVGDLEMQKTITQDFLTHKSIKNKGQAPRYYVESHHPALVDRVTWNKVQAMLYEKARTAVGNSSEGQSHPKPTSSCFVNLRCGARSKTGTVCGQPLVRQTYSRVAVGYSEWRPLLEGKGNGDMCAEKYYFSCPVWRCRGIMGKRKGRESTCTSQLLHECAIEQSFMEMLYTLKYDYEKNGTECWLYRMYRKVYEKTSKQVGENQVSIQRLETLNDEINELEIEMKERETGVEADSLSHPLDELKQHRSLVQWEQNILDVMENNFEFFLQCLERLPKTNPNGEQLKVCGLAEAGKKPIQMEYAPDFLKFERGIYCAFVVSGLVQGDEIVYTTNFGVKLRSVGNLRVLKDFLGFRKHREDGTVTILANTYEIYDNSIQRRQCKRSLT